MTPWVRRLIIANAVMLFMTMSVPLLQLRLSFVPVLVLRQPWTVGTVVTYMFLHAGLGHLFFNMLALFFFGPRLEARLGSRRFIGLYLASGLMAAALSAIFTPYARIVGASGAVYGVLLGFARYWPRDAIYIWGVLPIEARWLVGIMTALSLWGGMSGAGSGIAHFAHLGGFLGGYVYLRILERRSAGAKFRAMAQPHAKASRNPGADLTRWQHIDREKIHPVNRDEVERLLAKIGTVGMSSLTPEERALLDRFSAP